MKTKETALTVSTNVPEILTVLEEKIKSLKAITECNYKTGGECVGFATNLKEEKKLDNIIRMFASIKGRSGAYNASADEMGLSEYPEWRESNGNVEDWKHDCLLRKAVIEHKQTLDKLNEFKDKMSKFMSAEDQKAMLMKEMEKFLGQ